MLGSGSVPDSGTLGPIPYATVGSFIPKAPRWACTHHIHLDDGIRTLQRGTKETGIELATRGLKWQVAAHPGEERRRVGREGEGRGAGAERELMHGRSP